MNSLILKCVLFFTILYLFAEVLECNNNFRRHDIYRIIFQTRSKERFKVSFSSLFNSKYLFIVNRIFIGFYSFYLITNHKQFAYIVYIIHFQDSHILTVTENCISVM